VQVHVVDDAGARDPAEVPPEVEPLRPHRVGEHSARDGCEPVHVERLVRVQRPEVALVPPWRDHQVPGCVRVLVQEDECALAAMDDQCFLVVRLERTAEDAAGLLVRGLHVLEPPGRPELSHAPLVSPRAARRGGLVRTSPGA
jgi:hypothetical protein